MVPVEQNLPGLNGDRLLKEKPSSICKRITSFPYIPVSLRLQWITTPYFNPLATILGSVQLNSFLGSVQLNSYINSNKRGQDQGYISGFLKSKSTVATLMVFGLQI